MTNPPSQAPMRCRITRHALTRMQQRCVSPNVVRLIRAHGDIEMSVGGGCVELRISHRAAAALLNDGSATVVLVEKALRTALVLADDDGLVTVYLKNAIPSRRRRRVQIGRRTAGRSNWR